MIDMRTVDSSQAVEDFLVERLTERLGAGDDVLWLVPGGSNIAVAAAVSQRLGSVDHSHLYVTLTDERYGPVDHPDSNWRQLREAGFALPQATLLPVLTGKDMAVTINEYHALLETYFEKCNFALGFFGMGADGHVAGMLPGSAALSEAKLAAGYDAGQFQRLTMTPPALAQLDEAVAYATGEAKWPVLQGLQGDVPVRLQPAQLLKTVPRLTLFSDYKGDN